jgi:hypothetical protein
VARISDVPHPEEWTAEITMRDGGLPAEGAIRVALRTLGRQFEYRGLEVVVEGTLVARAEHPGQVVLRVPGLPYLLQLAPLREKVQWSKSRSRPSEPTDAERTAFRRLVGTWDGSAWAVRITGPLRGLPAGAPAAAPAAVTLEVRDFTVLASHASP